MAARRILARSVLAMLLATGLLVAACSVLGQAVVYLCGWDGWRWWAPALGYGVLMIIFGQAVHVPRHQTALFVLAVALAAVSLAFRPVRRAVRDVGADLLGLGALLILLAAIPFFCFGYAGILGASVSNDMAQHLATAYWLRHTEGFLPVAAIGGDLVGTGYPLGPHGLAAALGSVGLGDVRGFSALTLAVPVLTGFAAISSVPAARRAPRWALAAAVGLGYLPAAYLAQGSFKETILAMLVLATAVMLADLGALRGRVGWRQAMPLALFAGGAVYTYSYGGVLWLGAVTLFFIFAEVFRRSRLFAVVGDWWRAAVGAAAVAALVVLPELDRIRAFRHSIFGQESLRNKGNLAHALNPFETLGVWFNGDFRFNPDPRWPTVLFSAIALAALLLSFVWWWRRRSPALPAAVLAATLVWIELTQTVNIYNAAKGLIVLAPLVTVCLGAPLALAWSRRAGTPWSWLVRGVAVLLFVGVVIAAGGVLRSAPVGLGSHDDEFAQIRPVVKGKPVLFLENDHFAEWELRTANPLYTTNALYAPRQLGQHPEKTGGFPVDVDNYGRGELDKVDYIATSNGRYGSEIPPNFRLALRTASYDLYQRHGRTPTRQPIEPPGSPGTVFDCTSERGKQYLARYKWAGVLPRPVVSTAWQGSIAHPGDTARLKVTLPRGGWDVSLQYLSTTPVTVRAPGLTKRLAANFGLVTSFWDAGTVTSDGRPLTMSVTTDERTWFASLLGKPRGTRAPLSPGSRPIYQVAFTRRGSTPRRIPAREACGRYVDWFAPAGSRMRGRSDAR